MRKQTQKQLRAALVLTLVQNQLSNVCGALEDGVGQKFKPSPFCHCVRMTAYRDASQIDPISLWFECASLLDLGDSRIQYVEPHLGYFCSYSGCRCDPGT